MALKLLQPHQSWNGPILWCFWILEQEAGRSSRRPPAITSTPLSSHLPVLSWTLLHAVTSLDAAIHVLSGHHGKMQCCRSSAFSMCIAPPKGLIPSATTSSVPSLGPRSHLWIFMGQKGTRAS